MTSNNTRAKLREGVAPQRRNGKACVAAVLAAAAALISEKGYDATTMAEIAARARASIGSLYRFFPNKESLAAALIHRYAALVDHTFNTFDSQIAEQPFETIADAFLDLPAQLHNESKAMVALLETRPDWSDKRGEFRELVLKRIAKTLRLWAPALPERKTWNMAVILLQNMKTMKALTAGRKPLASPGAVEELRHMNRLYLADRTGKKLSKLNPTINL